jgi:GNAT superfamily N-acetyltransferase
MGTLRAAQPGEGELLSALAFRSKAHWGYSAAFMQACHDELSVPESAIREGSVFVLTAGAAIVGFFTLESPEPPRIELGHLFVEPARIRQGHGRRLMAHAASVARGLGFQILIIQGDPHALAFYESCGARRVGSRPSASIPGRVLPIFELALGSGTVGGGEER